MTPIPTPLWAPMLQAWYLQTHRRMHRRHLVRVLDQWQGRDWWGQA